MDFVANCHPLKIVERTSLVDEDIVTNLDVAAFEGQVGGERGSANLEAQRPIERSADMTRYEC
jgi:hypothetical protein